MSWVRRIIVFLLSVVLLISLLGIAISTALHISISHPNKIEGLLNQSNLYGNITTTITNQAQSAIRNNVPGGISISGTVIQQAVQTSFPQSLLKQSAQTIISSNYSWLEGQTNTPNFKIDLSGAKQEFANKVAQAYVRTHLTNLPACTISQIIQLQNADPLSLKCLPTGISPQYVAAQFSQQIASSSAYLSNPFITASTFDTKQGMSQPYYVRLANLPRAYQMVQKLPWILSVVAILSVIGIIFWARSKRRAIRRFSIIFMTSGIILILANFAANAGFNKLKDQAFKHTNDGNIQQSLISVAHNIEIELARNILWFGLTYIILALILFGIFRRTRYQRMKATNQTTQTQPVSGSFLENTRQQKLGVNNASSKGTGQRTTNQQNTRKRPRPPRPRGLIQ